MQFRARWVHWLPGLVLWCRYVLLLTLLFSPLTFSGETLRVAIAAEDYPPFYYRNQAGEMDGISVQVLQTVARQLGSQIDWQPLPWKRVMHHVQEGQADLIMVFYKTDVRAEQFIFSEVSYLKDSIVLLCHRPCSVHYDGDLKTLKVKDIAVVRGFSYGKVLDELPLVPVTKVASEEMLFHLLDNGRLQLGVASYLTVQHAPIFNRAKANVDVLAPYLAEVDIYFAFGRHSQLSAEQIAKFNYTLRHFVQSPEYEALLSRYQVN
ncbi:MAG: transporter substrate-binding domain-containing protein [Alkalimonas sp.]|nr:transporter substrate-binding domain-containing protein [Alkalimonas sp.]